MRRARIRVECEPQKGRHRQGYAADKDQAPAVKVATGFRDLARGSLKGRQTFRDVMERLLVDRIDRNLRVAVLARVVEGADLDDHRAG